MTCERDYWESYYLRSLRRRGELRREDCYCCAEQLLPLLGSVRKEMQALVVGAGTSELPELLAEHLEVSAVDVSPCCVAEMAANSRVRWSLGDAMELPKAWAEHFDLVVDKGLLWPKAAELQHEQCRQLLREYRRVLRPGSEPSSHPANVYNDE